MKSNRWGEDIICDTLQSNVILEILTAGITNPNPKYKMLQNISSSDLDYDCYNFEYVLSGSGYIETPEQTYSIHAGDFYFLNKLQYHIYYPDEKDPFQKEFIVVRGALADKLAELFRIRESVIVKHINVHPLFEQIKNSNSVAVHVRRGDYVSKPKYRKILYVCRKKYYENALNFISERVENARFFVASDDPKWVRENFAGKNITFIEPSGHFEDFYLMSQCRHAIISNSTFSWWSAWLGEARDHNRIIAAPDVWFTPQSKINFSDIIPNRWIKLPTGCGSADA